MIKRLTKIGTIRLLAAIRYQAEVDVRKYEKQSKKNNHGDYVSGSCLKSAEYYLKVELPVIREVISGSFKD